MTMDRTILLEHVRQSFDELGFKARGNQEDIILDVLDVFLNKGKRNVVLCAPVGIGKSIIAAVVSNTLHNLVPGTDKASTIAMGTNALSKQYADSFSNVGQHKVFQIKGAAQYRCAFMESLPGSQNPSAEDCTKLIPMEEEQFCSKCEYNAAKKIVKVTENLITNYAYFLTTALISNHIPKRKLHVFDEAHTLNDIFCSFSEVVISCELIDRYTKELSDVNGKCDNEVASLIMLKKYVEAGAITEDNYEQSLTMLSEVYKSAGNILEAQSSLLEKEDRVRSAKYSKMSKKYFRLASKISAMFSDDPVIEHVFDNSVPNTVTVKPIFIGDMMKDLLSDYNLFMSATITENFAFQTLNLEADETEFQIIDPVFPAANKPLFFIGKQTLNYQTMKEKETIDEMKRQVQQIITRHSGQKGLILVPSFYLGNQLSWGLNGVKVFEHKSGINLPDLIAEFKAYKGGAVLVSPSIYEGFDFPGSCSEFQILGKTPFPSLGDKRIKFIADNYPNIYKEMALLKTLQGIGRSIRTPEDRATTYFLDKSSKMLYDSKLNIWKNQYTVVGK